MSVFSKTLKVFHLLPALTTKFSCLVINVPIKIFLSGNSSSILNKKIHKCLVNIITYFNGSLFKYVYF